MFYGICKKSDGTYALHKMGSSLEGAGADKDGALQNRSSHTNKVEITACTAIWKSGKKILFL